jgi:hypothetical protein
MMNSCGNVKTFGFQTNKQTNKKKKDRRFLDQPSDYQLLKKDPTPRV